jgi:glycolate oxidase iron-sulfur subunit
MATFLRLYQRSGLQALVRRSGLLPSKLATAEAMLPKLPKPFEPQFDVYHAQGPVKHRVGLFVGCVMPLMYGPVHEATIRVLTWNGCEVHVPRQQTCCGALNVHGGERTVARDLARQNLQAFLGRGLDAVVVNSAGCGSTMKEYHELLGTEEAHQFATLTKDVNEFLASIELRAPEHPVHRTVTLQESCHLVHAQRIKAAPRALLAQVPGLTFNDMAHPDLCCGSAGIYSVTQHDMSMRVLDAKMEDVAATGATTVVTANPGCMMQLEAGLQRAGLPGEVRHVVEILDEAYAGRPGRS